MALLASADEQRLAPPMAYGLFALRIAPPLAVGSFGQASLQATAQ